MLRDLTLRRFGFCVLMALGIVCGVGATGLCIVSGLVDELFWRTCRISKTRVAEIRVEAAQTAALQFMRERERCAVNVGELVEDGYLTRDAARDPWGGRLLVQCFVQSDEVATLTMSAGDDGTFGTYDDVVVTDLRGRGVENGSND